MSHFHCVDRWGCHKTPKRRMACVVTAKPTRVAWTILDIDATSVLMSAERPMAGLGVERRLAGAQDGSWLDAVETVTNANKLGRVYRMVQQPRCGPPFLDETVFVDSNAPRGFMPDRSMPKPRAPSVVWPNALREGKSVNLRHLADS